MENTELKKPKGLNSLEQESYDKSVEILNNNPTYKEKAEELFNSMVNGYRSPFDNGRIQYQGDIFYSNISYRVDALGAFSTPKLRLVKNAVYDYVYSKLRLEGFYIHS